MPRNARAMKPINAAQKAVVNFDRSFASIVLVAASLKGKKQTQKKKDTRGKPICPIFRSGSFAKASEMAGYLMPFGKCPGISRDNRTLHVIVTHAKRDNKIGITDRMR